MAIAFRRAKPVTAGELIASRQLANLAAAWNDRLRSGLGDGTWRIYFLMLSLYRQIRTPDYENNAFPPADEFFAVYQHIQPWQAAWPTGPSGDTEGVNRNGAVGAWTHGNEGLALWDEAQRVGFVNPGTVGMDPVNGWDLAKEQRGGFDPATGAIGARKMNAIAHAHLRIGFQGNSPHGNSFGSWVKASDDNSVVVSKFQSEMLSRMLNAFAREFRGSDAQRSDPAYHLGQAADLQRFLTSQYHLAPAKGTERPPLDEPEPVVDVVYPAWRGDAPKGPGAEVGPRRNWAQAFALTGFKVIGSGLAADPVRVALVSDSGPLGYVWVSGENPAAVLYFPGAVYVPQGVRVELPDGLVAGSVAVEATELVATVPTLGDLYAVLRVSSAVDTVPDGVGTFFDDSRTVIDEYFRTGCAVNSNSDPGPAVIENTINENGVFDAMRRFSRCVRVMRRQEFTGYEVANDKSILYFRRTFTPGAGVTVDPWEGMTSIVHKAGPNGLTNEWLMDIELRPYDEDLESIFKPDSYTDYWALIQRCHFDSGEIWRSPPLLSHIAYGQGPPVLVPEAPPGWNYTIINGAPLAGNNVNTLDCGDNEDCKAYRKGFYRSCRIYEPPADIERIEVIGDEIKITLTGRLHHCPEAPGAIPRAIGSWELTDLKEESFRSLENGLREYLVHANGGTDCNRPGGMVTGQAGNAAMKAQIWATSSRPWGACFPRFRFTQLIPAPYEDANDEQDPTDTHFTHDPFPQMELYIRAMCEGYVDGQLSAETSCLQDAPTLYDYTFGNLCLRAFGRTRFSTIPGYAPGHGPLPNTEALAESYNQFVSAINLLTRVRVMLPAILECNTVSVTDYEAVAGEDGFGNPTQCGQFGSTLVNYPGSSPPLIAFDPDGWVECDGGIKGEYAITIDPGNCLGDLWMIRRTATEAKVRFAFTDGDVREAIPETWRGQFEEHPGILAKMVHCISTVERKDTANEAEATLCFDAEATDVPAFPSQVGWVVLEKKTVCDPDVCGFLDDAHVRGGTIGGTWLAISHNGHNQQCLEVGDAYHSTELMAWGGQVPTFTVPLQDETL